MATVSELTEKYEGEGKGGGGRVSRGAARSFVVMMLMIGVSQLKRAKQGIVLISLFGGCINEWRERSMRWD